MSNCRPYRQMLINLVDHTERDYYDEDFNALLELCQQLDSGDLMLVKKTEYDTETGLPATSYKAIEPDDYSDLREPMA